MRGCFHYEAPCRLEHLRFADGGEVSKAIKLFPCLTIVENSEFKHVCSENKM